MFKVFIYLPCFGIISEYNKFTCLLRTLKKKSQIFCFINLEIILIYFTDMFRANILKYYFFSLLD